MYLLVIGLDKIIFYGKKELHIPFHAENRDAAEFKADEILALWGDDVSSARLFELNEIQSWRNK